MKVGAGVERPSVWGNEEREALLARKAFERVVQGREVGEGKKNGRRRRGCLGLERRALRRPPIKALKSKFIESEETKKLSAPEAQAARRGEGKGDGRTSRLSTKEVTADADQCSERTFLGSSYNNRKQVQATSQGCAGSG